VYGPPSREMGIAMRSRTFGSSKRTTMGLAAALCLITAGIGPIEDIAPGDVVWIEPGEKHWHGASPTTAMTHVAIAEMLDGAPVQWMEKVNDEQYGGDSGVREE
jgi:hypothetical protein